MTPGEERSAAKLHPLSEAEKDYHRRMAGLRFSTDRAVSLLRLDRIIKGLAK